MVEGRGQPSEISQGIYIGVTENVSPTQGHGPCVSARMPSTQKIEFACRHNEVVWGGHRSANGVSSCRRNAGTVGLKLSYYEWLVVLTGITGTQIIK